MTVDLPVPAGIIMSKSPGYVRIEEGEGTLSGWPTRLQLTDLMTEDGLDALKKLTGGEGVSKLVTMLGSSPTNGISGTQEDIAKRQLEFGANYFETKQLKSYLALVWDGLHDMTIIMLIVMSVVSFIVEMGFGDHPETGWIESAAIMISVTIIVNVAAATDYIKERMFEALLKKLDTANTKAIVRNGRQLEVQDAEIVVGDILSFNAHNFASIPCDGVLVFGADVKMDESSLTGEPEPQAKDPVNKPFIVSGTEVVSGSGQMMVIAVGPYSVSGKIKAAVYGDSEDDEGSPLFQKLDKLVVLIGQAGFLAAGACFVTMCFVGFLIDGKPFITVLEYIITAITILAVAVPEGLPLAVTLSLTFSSNKMMEVNNLVKHLEKCETMGSATTICTDKTGTLTANRMTVRAASMAGKLLLPSDVASVGARLKEQVSTETCELLATLIAVDTMDESYLQRSETSNTLNFKGNPTECALLTLANDMGYDYAALRSSTKGRSNTTKQFGKPFMFSSARKMMSWAVPLPSGGWRLYSKGASEIILGRCTSILTETGTAPLDEEGKTVIVKTTISRFASEAMRTIGLAYREFSETPNWDVTREAVLNANGTKAFEVETGLTLLGVVGIEDPLRPEVAPAIEICYQAGIDVRMVTGDNLDTAVAIANRCGILKKELHFEPDPNPDSLTGFKPKKFRAMEGKVFRKMVYRTDPEGGEPIFDQAAFDKIWPYLRVLARSSPEDKVTLADGLNKSMLFADKQAVANLAKEGIVIFPDRQVVAMTGDGTNDAKALKRADIGFAMNITGTQIAKDACDIVLTDDNFASIVTAAKWGRNVYDSISKFLQFQLTVNIVAVTLAIVGAFAFQVSPIAAVQMLWINLIMDSLASLALATEPPDESLLKRPPVNRSLSMVTQQMWFNMFGHALYQIVALLWLVFHGPKFFDIPYGVEYMDSHGGAPSQHFTIVFTLLVMMTLFNEVNCRKLHGETNVFEGVMENSIFVAIVGSTFVLQCLATQFGGRWLKCYEGGITLGQWAFCLILGVGVLAWQQVINFLVRTVVSIEKKRERQARRGGLLKFSSSYGSGHISLPRGGTERTTRSSEFKRAKTASGIGYHTPGPPVKPTPTNLNRRRSL